MLPSEMIKEFVGKVCYISVFDSTQTLYRLVQVEDNWIKVKNESGEISIINGDLVKSIHMAKDKHQNKCQ